MQKHKEEKINGYYENFYLCPTCKQWVSGRVSWVQNELQKHYKCLNICVNPFGNLCEHHDKFRVEQGCKPLFCEKKYRCKHKKTLDKVI